MHCGGLARRDWLQAKSAGGRAPCRQRRSSTGLRAYREHQGQESRFRPSEAAELARALAIRPRLLLLDEPAGRLAQPRHRHPRPAADGPRQAGWTYSADCRACHAARRCRSPTRITALRLRRQDRGGNAARGGNHRGRSSMPISAEGSRPCLTCRDRRECLSPLRPHPGSSSASLRMPSQARSWRCSAATAPGKTIDAEHHLAAGAADGRLHSVFDGQPLGRLGSHHDRQGADLQVPGGREVFRDMSVRENLDMGASPAVAGFRRRARRSGTLSSPTPRCCAERLKQRPARCPGRAADAADRPRRLMARPRLLLLDETLARPVAGAGAEDLRHYSAACTPADSASCWSEADTRWRGLCRPMPTSSKTARSCSRGASDALRRDRHLSVKRTS